MKVSVLLATYNHEKWIAQAIDSVLLQKTNFDYEVVIMEDCSTDSTRDIVTDFQNRYPDRIRLILSEKNKYDNTNFVTAWQTSPSQYVAILDGDDYWASPHKLQKQVDFLDTHAECAVCFHNVTILYEDKSREPWDHAHPKPKEFSTLEDLLERNIIPGPSPMLRKGLFGEFPTWFNTQRFADWALYILNAQHGKIGYIDELMAVYRVHSRGVWSGLSGTRKLKEIVGFYESMNANLNFRYDEIVHTTIARVRLPLAVQGIDEVRDQIKSRQWKRAMRGALVLLRYYPQGLLALLSERRSLAVRLRNRQQQLQARKRQLRLHERRLQALHEQPGHREQQRRVEELEGALAEERREVQRLGGRTQHLALRIQRLDRRRARSGRAPGVRKLLKRLGRARARMLGR
jgi:glycosyltransferase involved in cell wall biosynthesis